ncbi:hypothetical protein BDY19DRAFT_1060197 [Irpex rosettiformis]|uniref:Uncharacterized protein n=1 Tax=Irpex rosettiformis TaxID=378272 RepID=A0ACB8TRH2_9APHY|nr:hypothetical protein BDY19DRAFT_1060197 [Irpex rosettiformis]
MVVPWRRLVLSPHLTVHPRALNSRTMAHNPQLNSLPLLNQELLLTDVPQTQNHQPEHRYAQLPTIDFSTDRVRGVRLEDAIEGNFSAFGDQDVQVMDVPGDKVTYMFEWPGVNTVRKQVNARRKHGVQNRDRIVQQIAKIVEKFLYEQYENMVFLFPAGHALPIPIEFKDIYLIELKRISRATWVAKLAVPLELLTPAI